MAHRDGKRSGSQGRSGSETKPEGRGKEIDREKVQSIISVVMQSLDQPHILVSGFNALTFFCERASPQQQQQIVREGAIHVLLATMWTNFKNEDLMALVCNCLWCLSANQDSIKSMIAKEGGIPAILVALRSHPGNPELVRSPWVAEAGIQSLSMALRKERPDSLLNCCQLETPAARELNIRSILNVMSTGHDPIVIQLACDALWILALSRVNVAVITKLDGVQIVATQMQAYPTHVDMLKSACGALWNVSENSDLGSDSEAGHSGFFTSTRVVIETMSSHPGHPELQKNATSYLRNAAADAGARSVLEKDGSIGVLLSVLRVFRSDTEFLEVVLDVLLCLNYSGFRTLVYDGMLAAVVPLFKLYQESSEIIRRACMLVSLLLSHAVPSCISSKSWALLTQPHGLARTLLRLSRRLSLSSAVLSAVCSALSALSQLVVKEASDEGSKCDDIVRVAVALLREDDVRCLCETIRNNKDNVSLCTMVVRVLHNLIVLQPPQGCNKYLTACADNTLAEVMHVHPQELELHSLSTVAIAVLLSARRSYKTVRAGKQDPRPQISVITQLGKSLKQFLGDPKQSSRSVKALGQASPAPEEIDPVLRSLLAALQAFTDNTALSRDICGVLGTFWSAGTEAALGLSEEGAATTQALVGLMCGVLHRGGDDASVPVLEMRNAALQGLVRASAAPWSSATVTELSLVPAMLDLFQQPECVPTNVATNEMVLACEVLQALSEGSEEIVKQIVLNNGFEVIFSATQRHKDSVHLLKHALEVLSLMRTNTPANSPQANNEELIPEPPAQSEVLSSASSDDEDDEDDAPEPEPEELAMSPAFQTPVVEPRNCSTPQLEKLKLPAGGEGMPSEPRSRPPTREEPKSNRSLPSLRPDLPAAQMNEKGTMTIPSLNLTVPASFPVAPDDQWSSTHQGDNASTPAEPFFHAPKTLVPEMIMHDLERLASEVRGYVVYDYFDERHVEIPPPEVFQRKRAGSASGHKVATKPLQFDSRFESGNLRRAVYVGDNEYDLMLRVDVNTKGNTQWYYFTVSNMEPGVEYKLNIINLLKPDSQYNYGMRPLMFSEAAGTVGWHRVGSDICYYQNHHGNQSRKKSEGTFYTLTFKTQFPHDSDRCHLAYCYPYTYTRLQRYLDRLEVVHSKYIRRRCLCRTLGGYNTELLTITDFECTPEQMGRRKGVVLSARVHPGESNASWIMQGIIDFLCSDSNMAMFLRETFVFKIVPMLNPDGVIHGNYRCSLAGVDLNRKWGRPSKKLNPSIYYTKQMISKLQETREVFAFVDIHGHSRKKNAFMYGVESRHTQRFQECVLPRLLSQNGTIFAFNDCSYVVPKSKETTARVVVARELGIPNSYTLEASFCGANFGKYNNAHFTTHHFNELGQAFCKTLCDLTDPSRVSATLDDLQALHRKGADGVDDDGDSDWEGNNDSAEPPKKSKGKKGKEKKARGDKKDLKKSGVRRVKASKPKDATLTSRSFTGKGSGSLGEAGEEATVIPTLTSRSRRLAQSKRQVSAPSCVHPPPRTAGPGELYPALGGDGFDELANGLANLRRGGGLSAKSKGKMPRSRENNNSTIGAIQELRVKGKRDR